MFEKIYAQDWFQLFIQYGLEYWQVLFAFLLAALLFAGTLNLFRRREPLVVFDGSNILYWNNEVPDLRTVRSAVDVARAKGYAPIVWFDANVGYLVSDGYLGPVRLARALGLPAQQVMVSPSGTPADPLILRMAQRRKALIVTNDRYRDWQEDFPILRKGSLLVCGYWARGRVQLKDLPTLR